MRKNPRRILSPQRLPFRHPGDWQNKSNEHKDLLQHRCRRRAGRNKSRGARAHPASLVTATPGFVTTAWMISPEWLARIARRSGC